MAPESEAYSLVERALRKEYVLGSSSEKSFSGEAEEQESTTE